MTEWLALFRANVAVESGFNPEALSPVGAIGLGVNEAAACRDALVDGDFDVFLLAGRYTLLEQEPLDGLLPQCLAS